MIISELNLIILPITTIEVMDVVLRNLFQIRFKNLYHDIRSDMLHIYIVNGASRYLWIRRLILRYRAKKIKKES